MKKVFLMNNCPHSHLGGGLCAETLKSVKTRVSTWSGVLTVFGDLYHCLKPGEVFFHLRFNSHGPQHNDSFAVLCCYVAEGRPQGWNKLKWTCQGTRDREVDLSRDSRLWSEPAKIEQKRIKCYSILSSKLWKMFMNSNNLTMLRVFNCEPDISWHGYFLKFVNHLFTMKLW